MAGIQGIARAMRIKRQRKHATTFASIWGKRQSTKEKKIGARGFEPPTSPTPRVRATRLRHAPINAAWLIQAKGNSKHLDTKSARELF